MDAGQGAHIRELDGRGMIYSSLLYALCLTIATLGAWTDLHSGNMRNAHILAGAALGAALSAVAILRGMPAWPSFLSWCVNFALATLVGVLFYLSDIWAPGDAKLYMLLAALMPRQCYAARTGNIFPALDIVIYAYAAGYLYLLFSAKRKESARLLKRELFRFDRASMPRLLRSIGFFSGAQMLVHAAFPAFAQDNYALILLAAMGLQYLIESKAPALMKLLGCAGIAASLVCCVAAGQYSTMLVSLLLSAALALVSRALYEMASVNSYREIPGDEVSAGAILSLGSVLAMQRCIDPNIPRSTTESRRSRLSARQAEAVRNWCKITGRTVAVVEMLPFVPFMLAALILEPLRSFLFA